MSYTTNAQKQQSVQHMTKNTTNMLKQIMKYEVLVRRNGLGNDRATSDRNLVRMLVTGSVTIIIHGSVS